MTILPCTELQRDFARALSPHYGGVRPVTAENGLGPAVHWTHVDQQAPYAVLVGYRGRFHTLALDFDAGADGLRADQAARDADAARRLLRLAGIDIVMAASGPSGGRHVLATIAGGLSPSIMGRLMRGVQRVGFQTLDVAPMSNVKTGAIRPPLAPHRRGGRSEIISHDLDQALRMLNRGHDPDLFALLADALPHGYPPAPLRPATANPQVTTPVIKQRTYASGSDEVFGEALRAINRGETFDAFFAAMRSRASDSDPVASTLDKHQRKGDLVPWLRRTWRKAAAQVEARPAVWQVASVDDAAVIASWLPALPAIESDSSRRVAEILLRMASGHNRALVGASVRSLGEMTGQSRSTADRGLRWLRDHGVVEVAGESDGRRATRYRLIHADLWGCDAGGTVSPTLDGGVRWPTVPELSQVKEMATDLSLDLWCRQGLGESGRQTLLALTEGESGAGEVHVSQVATRLGRSRRTVERTLKRLGEVGLARRLGSGKWTAEFRDPAEVAKVLGVAGWRARLLDRHADERRQHGMRRVEQRLEYLLKTEKWRHLDDLVYAHQIEKRSQIGRGSLSIAPRQTIVIEQPLTGPTLTDGAGYLALADYEPSAAALDSTGGSN